MNLKRKATHPEVDEVLLDPVGPLARCSNTTSMISPRSIGALILAATTVSAVGIIIAQELLPNSRAARVLPALLRYLMILSRFSNLFG
jgi:hypothetical protein